MGIGNFQASNKVKKLSEEQKMAQDEAKGVLIDLLTSMLAKSQSFLREVANTCFKFFCVDCINENNLMSLLTIVSTANADAGEIMDGDAKAGDLEEGDDEEGDEDDDDDSLEEIDSDSDWKLK